MAFINRWHCFLFVFAVLALSASADDIEQCLEYNITDDYQSAYPVCKRAAEQGDAYAQLFLGLMYESGNGVEQDKAEAARWYRQAGEQGYTLAQYSLGLMYYEGDGVEQDKVEAAKWWRQAAEQGHAGAQNNLGVMYENGEGVEQDKVEAVRWYQKAAEQRDSLMQIIWDIIWEGKYVQEDVLIQIISEGIFSDEQGLADAQYNLGLMYDNGEGVEQDKVEAERWYRQAAEQGFAEAQYSLGLMYNNDDGITKDPQEAYIWLLLAANNGIESAVQAKETLEQELTASERSTAAEEANRRQQKIREH